MLDAFAKGNTPPEPEVDPHAEVGDDLTLRTAVHLPLAGGNPVPGDPDHTARVGRAVAQPLAGGAASGSRRRCGAGRLRRPHDRQRPRRRRSRRSTSACSRPTCSYRAEARADQALGDLDDRILARLHATAAVAIDRPITVQHTTRIPGSVTFFELEGLLRSLRRLVVGARPLRPADLVRQSDAQHGRSGRVDRAARTADRRADRPARHAPAGTRQRSRPRSSTPARTIDEVIGRLRGRRVAARRVSHPGRGHGLRARVARRDVCRRDRRCSPTRVTDWDAAPHVLRPRSWRTTRRCRRRRRPKSQLQLLRTAEALVSTTVSSGLAPPAELLAVHGRSTTPWSRNATCSRRSRRCRGRRSQISSQMRSQHPTRRRSTTIRSI